MTEEEAKTKVCKQVLINIPESYYPRVEYLYCLASACMLWNYTEGEYLYSCAKVDDSGWEETTDGLWRKRRENSEGYCGLGGYK